MTEPASVTAMRQLVEEARARRARVLRRGLPPDRGTPEGSDDDVVPRDLGDDVA
jgi:hypothetical protein